jgi:hypothetical protein
MIATPVALSSAPGAAIVCQEELHDAIRLAEQS